MLEGFLEPHMKENAKGNLIDVSLALFIEGCSYVISCLIIGCVSYVVMFIVISILKTF